MPHYILPANQTESDMWECTIPASLTFEVCVIYPCCHLDKNGLAQTPLDGTLCPDCEAIFRGGRWESIVPPVLTDRKIYCLSSVRLVPS
jgi:NMD protein affecting ribosome stability and mRNA decay